MGVMHKSSAGRRAAVRRARPAPRAVAPPVRPAQRTASRTRSAGIVALVMGTILVAIGGYTISSRVAAERQELAGIARTNAALSREVEALQTEWRVRMRLPQLQKWNDGVMRMQPASASQLLSSPVELAIFAAAPAATMQVAPRLASLNGQPALPPLRAMPLPSVPGASRAMAKAETPGMIPPALPPTPSTLPPTPPGLVLASVEAVLEAAPRDPAPVRALPAGAVAADSSLP